MQMAQERLHSTFKAGRILFAKQMIREVVDRRNLCYCLVSHLVFFHIKYAAVYSLISGYEIY